MTARYKNEIKEKDKGIGSFFIKMRYEGHKRMITIHDWI